MLLQHSLVGEVQATNETILPLIQMSVPNVTKIQLLKSAYQLAKYTAVITREEGKNNGMYM